MDRWTGLYIHVPFCVRKCRYCGFYSEPIAGHDTKALVSAIILDLKQHDLCKDVKTVYIGGGSPSSLPAEQLLMIVAEIAGRSCGVEEFTVEVNPRQVDEKTLSLLRKAGVDRLSIGAQSFNQKELDFLGRDYSVNAIENCVQMGRKAGFKNVSVDLIFAIPGSCLDSWTKSLQAAIDLGVEHISAYSLTYEAGSVLQKELKSGVFRAVDENLDRAMYELAIDRLGEAGIDQYEISNFARAGFECRHNLGYWANNDYIGIGPAAAWFLNGLRGHNIADVKKYVEAIAKGESVLAESEKSEAVASACETAVLNLRRKSGIDLEQFRKRTGFDATELFAEAISRHRQSGLIMVERERVFLTRQALPIADSVLCDFSTA